MTTGQLGTVFPHSTIDYYFEAQGYAEQLVPANLLNVLVSQMTPCLLPQTMENMNNPKSQIMRTPKPAKIYFSEFPQH